MPTILNTAYNVQTDILESESNISVENGTLHVYNDNLKVHLQNTIKEIVTTDSSTSIAKNGSFLDLTSQSVDIGAIAAVKLGTTIFSNGVTVSNNSRINVDYSGIYNLQFSMQLRRTSGGGVKQVIIWLRVNGVDVPNSATHVTFQASSDYLIPAWNFFIDMTSGQYVELMWTQDDAIILTYEAANTIVPYPAVPSVILTMNKIN
jgi:hypothetical protein